MRKTQTRHTGHQAMVVELLQERGRFTWRELKPYVLVDQAFRDSVYKAIERLRKRGWEIRAIVGGYVLEEEGD